MDSHSPISWAVPESGKGRAVVLVHAWWGLNHFFKALAADLAQAGFLVAAPDLYQGKTAATIAEARALRKGLDRSRAAAEIQTAVQAVLAHPGCQTETAGLVGFSLGAWLLLGVAAEHPDGIGAVVTFYGNRTGKYHKCKAAFQCHFAETDEYVSLDDRERFRLALQASSRPAEFYVYPGTKHWFFENDRPEYDPQAAGLARGRTIDFLNHTLT